MNEFLDLSRYFYSDDWQSLGVPFTPLDMEIGNLLEELDLQGGPMVPFVAALVSNAAKEGHICLTIDRIVERLNRMGEKPVAVPDALKSMLEAMRAYSAHDLKVAVPDALKSMLEAMLEAMLETMRAYSAHDLKRALENHLGVANAPSDAMAFKPLVLEQGRVMAVLGRRGNHCPLYQKTGSDLATKGFRKNACRGFAFATGRHSKSCVLPFLCFDGRPWHWQDLDCFAYSCCRAGKACAGEETIFKNNIGRTNRQSSSPA